MKILELNYSACRLLHEIEIAHPSAIVEGEACTKDW